MKNRIISCAIGIAALLLAMVPISWASAAPQVDPPPQLQAAGMQARTLTLVTGDKVTLSGAEKAPTVAFHPAADRPPHGYVSRRTGQGHLEVIPTDVLPLVPRVLDPALFDVTALLADYGDDAKSSTIPVIVAGAPATEGVAAAKGASTGKARTLASIKSQALKVRKARAGGLGAVLAEGARDLPATPRTQDRVQVAALPKSLPTKVWLDRRVKVSWDRNIDQVKAPLAWAKSRTGSGVTIAVLDTGVDADHPDLKGQVVAAQNFSSAETSKDFFGHGTHVASIAAGTGAANAKERRGIGFGAKVLNAKVLDDGGYGDFSEIIAGIEWAGAQKATVANLSIQGPPSDGTDPMSLAINATSKDKGTFFVVAAGNYGGGNTIGSPAAAEEALTVGAVDGNDKLAEFSSFGPRMGGGIKPEITAPGVDIMAARSTLMGEGSGDYIAFSGTSMATPHVAGAAAVVRAARPGWTAQQAKAALIGTAEENPSLSVYQQGGGRLNVAAAADNVVMPVNATMDFGLIPFAQKHDPIARQVGWTNTSGKDVTLNLSVKPNGKTPPNMVSVTPATLTVKAGQTANATLALAVDATQDLGVFGGEVVATPAVGSVDVADGIAFAFEKEPLRHTVTFKAIGDDGKPTQNVSAMLLNLADFEGSNNYPYVEFTPLGEAKIRVAEGTYHVEATVYSNNEYTNLNAMSWIVKPQVKVTSDTTVVLDARKAKPVNVTIEGRSTTMRMQHVIEKRTDAQGKQFTQSMSTGSDLTTLKVAPVAPVTIGQFDTLTMTTKSAPQLRLVAPEFEQSFPRPIWGAERYTKTATLPVKVIGKGTPAQFATAKAAGSLAVVTRSELKTDLVVANAKAAKVALLVIVNSSEEPWDAYIEEYDPPKYAVPAYTLDGKSGKVLMGKTSLKVAGMVVASPTFATYQEVHGNMPSSRTVSIAEQAQMARVSQALTDIQATGAGQVWTSFSRAPFRPEYGMIPMMGYEVKPGYRWTEYVQPGNWISAVDRGDQQAYISFISPVRREVAKTARSETWMKAPWHSQPFSYNYAGRYGGGYRQGDTMMFHLGQLADGEGHFYANASEDPGMSVNYTLKRNGTLVKESSGPDFEVAVPAGRSSYELGYVVKASALSVPYTSTTLWKFTSATPPNGGWQDIPLLDLGINLPVNLKNQLVGSTVKLTAKPVAGPGQRLVSATMALSTDGGSTWKSVKGVITGNETATVTLPKLPAGARVSLRVDAVTTGGLSIRQTLTDAVLVK